MCATHSFSSLLMKLPVLECRFQYTYASELDCNFSDPFNTNTPFLNSVMDAQSPETIAMDATKSDQHDFGFLSPTGFMTGDLCLRTLNAKSDQISREIEECYRGHPLLLGFIDELVQVSEP